MAEACPDCGRLFAADEAALEADHANLLCGMGPSTADSIMHFDGYLGGLCKTITIARLRVAADVVAHHGARLAAILRAAVRQDANGNELPITDEGLERAIAQSVRAGLRVVALEDLQAFDAAFDEYQRAKSG